LKLLGFDDRGKVRLSMKLVDQETGEDLSKKPQPPEERSAAGRLNRFRLDITEPPGALSQVG